MTDWLKEGRLWNSETMKKAAATAEAVVVDVGVGVDLVEARRGQSNTAYYYLGIIDFIG